MKLFALIAGGPKTASPNRFVLLRCESASFDEPNGIVLGFPYVNTRQEAHELMQDMQECVNVLEDFILEDLPSVPNSGVHPAFAPILESICPAVKAMK